jgi:hypothetical protein
MIIKFLTVRNEITFPGNISTPGKKKGWRPFDRQPFQQYFSLQQAQVIQDKSYDQLWSLATALKPSMTRTGEWIDDAGCWLRLLRLRGFIRILWLRIITGAKFEWISYSAWNKG